LRKKRLTLAVLSLIILALVACGRKGNPRPISLPTPATISDLRGDVRDGVLLISFTVPTKNRDGTPVKDLAGFQLVKSCGPCGGQFEPWKDVRLVDKQGYTIRNGRLYVYDDDLVPGYVYEYRVYPYTNKGTRLDGSNFFAIKWQKPPGLPADVTGEAQDSKVVLSWQKADKLTCNVYRWDNNIYPINPVNSAPLAGDTFTDFGLQNGKTYKYAVRAVRTEGTFQFEGEGASVTLTPKDMTPPTTPTAPKLEKKDDGVLISWQASPEADVAGYNVYKFVVEKPEKINAELVATTQFFDPSPGLNVRYVAYYVTAVDKSGNESGPSREQIIVIKE
jgi:predicted small lipoprotein YifL